MTLLFFFGASSLGSSALFPPSLGTPVVLCPLSDPDTDILGKANPSFSSPGVGKTGSIELVVLLLLPPGWNNGVEDDWGGKFIDDTLDPSLSVRLGAGEAFVAAGD